MSHSMLFPKEKKYTNIGWYQLIHLFKKYLLIAICTLNTALCSEEMEKQKKIGRDDELSGVYVLHQMT